MNHPNNTYKSNTNKGLWLLRSLCMICAVLLCLTACIACTPNASSSSTSSEDLAALEDMLAKAEQELQALKAENEATKEKLAQLEEIDIDREDKHAALYAVLQEEIATIKTDCIETQATLDSLQTTHEAAQAALNALEADYAATKQALDTLEAEHAVTKQELDALKESYAAAKEELDALKDQLQQMPSVPPAPEPPTQKIRIYIDQGHNPTSYHNAGASSGDLYEQDLTFAIGHLLATLLEEDGRFDVCLSRPTASTVLGTDNTSSLEARVQGAKDFGADYFISLHTNSFTSDTANGIEVLVAEPEGESYDFGNCLLNGLIISTRLRNRGMKQNPDLYILKNATMPTAIVEMGFISNATDAALLSQNPELFAEGIYDGILTYFDLSPQSGTVN